VFDLDGSEQDKAREYFYRGPDWLIKHSVMSRKAIVLGIQKQWREAGWISEKQQWVLAFWIDKHNQEPYV
jgi:hypothetical protein